MKRRLVALSMVLVLTTGMLSGCGSSGRQNKSEPDSQAEASNTGNNQATDVGKGGNEELAEKKEIVNIKIHTCVPEQADENVVFEALNEYSAEKIGVTADWVFHGGNYGDKIQTIIASGEEYDACFTSNWKNPYSTNVAKGAFIDIKDMLPEIAPGLFEIIPDYLWKGSTINGGIYGVPNQQIVARQLAFSMPKELVDQTGVDVKSIKKISDSAEYAGKALEINGSKIGGVEFSQVAAYCGYECVNDTYSAGVIRMDDEDAHVVNFYETEEWKDLLSELAELNALGLLDGQCSYMSDYGEAQRLAMKVSILFGGTYKPGVEAEESARNGYETIITACADEPYISTSSVTATMYGISVTSKHPEETLKYLELLNTDPYMMNTISYGIEGMHYIMAGDNVIELISDSGYYPARSWAFGNVFNTYVLTDQPEDVWEQTKALNDSAKSSPILGFTFDPEPVKNEITNVSKVVKEYEGMLGGELPVEETNEEFVDKLEVAGVDVVIAEMQRQIDEFRK